jgi:hypothetical protein
MVIGLQQIAAAIVAYKDEIVDPEGGMALVVIDGLLLIPVMMAAFFYPGAALMALGFLAVCTVGGLVALRQRGRRQAAVSEPATPLQTTSVA